MPTQRRIYRGCDFESWNNQQACFWVAPSALRLAAPQQKRGAHRGVCGESINLSDRAMAVT